MLYRITSTMFGMEFQRQMSRKLSVERRTTWSSKICQIPTPDIWRLKKPTPKWCLIKFITYHLWFRLEHQEKKTSREKIRSSKEIGCTGPLGPLRWSGEVWGIYFPNSDIVVHIKQCPKIITLHCCWYGFPRVVQNLIGPVYWLILKRFGHCSRG